MLRIYKVTTPSGMRAVESSTRGQAVNYCVGTDYSAEPMSASELNAFIQSGGQVEKVIAPEKKSAEPSSTFQPPLTTQAPQAALSPSPTTHPQPQAASQSFPSSNTLNAQAHNAATGTTATVAPPANFNLPGGIQAGIVHPVLAEQQRINPTAATAAGAPPLPPAPNQAAAPILPRSTVAPSEWQDRQK